jgi:hypothetical protein
MVQKAEPQAAVEAHALWRGVNETIAAAARLARETEATFVCECGSYACVRRIKTTLDVYDGLRAAESQYLLARGHDHPAGERVVAVGEAFEIAELGLEDEPIARDTGGATNTPLLSTS